MQGYYLIYALCVAQCVLSAEPGGLVAAIRPEPWPPATSASVSVQDLHREYPNIFRHGNRNAASHLWATFLLDRSRQMTWERLEFMFTGFCAVSGSPVRPTDYSRYELTLPRAGGGAPLRGFMFYCCWPCVCDTQDFIRADTLTITAVDGVPRVVHVAVIGDPCARPAALRESFVQPFDQRETTLEREAPEVRCSAAGELLGATRSDHGHVVIQLFPLVGDGAPRPAGAIAAAAVPGRISELVAGESGSGVAVKYQAEAEFAPSCAERAAAGFNSGMGEIFRRVAQISPIATSAEPKADAEGESAEGEAPLLAAPEVQNMPATSWERTPRVPPRETERDELRL